jgi:hypothetical protein
MAAIRHAAFKHGWYYHYRVHEAKLDRLSGGFPGLKEFLLRMFDECPHDYFLTGPRSSKLQLPLDFDITHIPGHEICTFADFALQNGRFKTAHSNVQVAMIEHDNRTVASEVPLWLLPEDLPGYEGLIGSSEPLTGHIDLLSIQDGLVWVWDFKPGAAKERHAHVQTWVYAEMLARRTGLPITAFRCGWFDERDCYVFAPPRFEELLLAR